MRYSTCAVAFATMALLGGCAKTAGGSVAQLPPNAQCGEASWYGEAFRGRTTANGETFDPDAMTAAHKTLPFGTMLVVQYHGKRVEVRINDRGPFSDNRVLDLSKAAAQRLGYVSEGVAEVCFAVKS